MGAFLEIVPIINGNENETKFTTSIGCYQLDMILTNWKENHYIDYSESFTEEDIKILKTTFGKESFSVQEGYANFEPNIVSIYKLNNALIKLKQKMIYPVLKDSILKGKTEEIPRLITDLIVISECIGVLEFMKHSFQEIYIAAEDC